MQKTSRSLFHIVRALICLLFAVGVWFSVLLTDLSIQETAVLNRIDVDQRRKEIDSDELLILAGELRERAVLEGQYSDIYANVLSLLAERTDEHSVTAILEAYREAILYHPYNSELWSRFAVYATQIAGMQDEVLAAVDMALKLGKNDYLTLKDLIYVGIKEWPELDCHYKSVLLERIAAGLRKNDIILSRWNVEHRHMSIGQYTTALMTYFDFNETWAENQVAVCKSKLI